MVQSPILLSELHKDPARVVATSAGASLIDLDDGVLCLEFHSKGNTLDADSVGMMEAAYEVVPKRFAGLVIGNQGSHFSFGANLGWILSVLAEMDGDRAQFSPQAKRVQRAVTGMREAPFPVVAAPFGLTIGGALELSMYCDRMQAYSDMNARLPEVAVGILPDLGGTSEVYIRNLDSAGPGNELDALRLAFQTVTMMTASGDAEGARRLHFLKPHDRVSQDKATLLNDAKARVLELAAGYVTPKLRAGVPVLGDTGYQALDQMVSMAVQAGIATAYDGEVARAIALIMTGGPGPARTVSHQELLDLETQQFETLIWNPKTRARMEHMLQTGEPLRN